MAAAPLSVTAVSTSSGVSLYFRHPRLMTNCILRHGQEPGLKSVDMATGTPAFTISRAGANAAPRLKLVAGSRHAITPLFAMLSMPSGGQTIRCSAEIAPSSPAS